jgi:hypothetical protein
MPTALFPRSLFSLSAACPVGYGCTTSIEAADDGSTITCQQFRAAATSHASVMHGVAPGTG